MASFLWVGWICYGHTAVCYMLGGGGMNIRAAADTREHDGMQADKRCN